MRKHKSPCASLRRGQLDRLVDGITDSKPENQACCACLAVKYDPEDVGMGRLRERWSCSECGTEFVRKPRRESMSCMLEDVVNELDLSDAAIQEHGPLGTPPAVLVRLVLDQKDKAIQMLKAGMREIEHES